MGKEKQQKPENLIHKQTLYIAVLVSLTIGFVAGAAYTSFKLSGTGNAVATGAPPQGMPPQGMPQAGEEKTDARVAARILELEEFVKAHPGDVNAWIELGNIFFDSNRYKDAIEAYERALAISPGDPNVLTDLGVMYRRDKDPQKAIEYFDKAIAARPDFETARFNKGVVLMHDLNDLPGAVKVWEELVEINPMAQAPNGQLVNTLLEGLKKQTN